MQDVQVKNSLHCFQNKLEFIYNKTCLKWPLKKKTENWVFKTDYRLMQVKSIKLPFVIKIFVLSIFEWLLKKGFNVILKKISTQWAY